MAECISQTAGGPLLCDGAPEAGKRLCVEARTHAGALEPEYYDTFSRVVLSHIIGAVIWTNEDGKAFHKMFAFTKDHGDSDKATTVVGIAVVYHLLPPFHRDVMDFLVETTNGRLCHGNRTPINEAELRA